MAMRRHSYVGLGILAFGAAAVGCAVESGESESLTQALSYGSSPAAVPGRVEAENYDLDGPGVAYNDSTSGNSGGAHRNEDVDIQVSSQGGFNVGWIAAGEWMRYSVNVASSGSYTLTLSVASQSAGGSLHVEVGGVDVSGPLAFPATGGWQTWTTVTIPDVQLVAGSRQLRVVADTSSFNLDWLEFSFNQPPATSDPTCSTGILNAEGTACCDAACGSCGGSGCDARPGGQAACCTSGVTAAAVSCSGNLPPCVMGGSEPEPEPEPTSDPTCSTGILNAEGTACCDAACGSCGGSGCDARPGGQAACCTSGVTAAAVSCSGNLPPCVMGGTGGSGGGTGGSAPTAAAVIQAMDGGFNLGNVFDNGAQSSDFNSNKQIIDLYKNGGMKHVRFPVTWVDSVNGSTLANGGGTVNFNHSRFVQLKQLIDYALSQGLYVVLNTHHEHWLKDNYTGSTSQDATFRTLWQSIANHFKDYPPQLIFEVLNEPEGAFGDWSPPGPLPTDGNSQQLTRKINLVGYNAIRGTGGKNTTRIIMVAPNAQGNQSMIDEIYPNKASLPGSGNDQYLAIQVHTYDPWGFCGQTGNNSNFPGTGTISGNIQAVANHASGLGVPINYGEFGVGRQTNQAERNTNTVRSYYSTVADKTLSLNMSYTVWDDRGWFGLVNGSNSGFLYNIVPSMRKQ